MRPILLTTIVAVALSLVPLASHATRSVTGEGSSSSLQTPSRTDVLQALRKAAEFYSTQVATQGGYHYYYAEDLSYGRSEHSEGPTQIEVQREATPIVGLAFLTAYEATGDRYYLEAARSAAHALVKGQLCSGGWDYTIEFDPAKRKRYPYRSDNSCAAANSPTAGAKEEGQPPPTTLDDNNTQGAMRLMMRVDLALNFTDKQIHEAVIYALDQFIKAQYPNGAWPQRYRQFPDPAKLPVKKANYPDS